MLWSDKLEAYLGFLVFLLSSNIYKVLIFCGFMKNGNELRKRHDVRDLELELYSLRDGKKKVIASSTLRGFRDGVGQSVYQMHGIDVSQILGDFHVERIFDEDYHGEIALGDLRMRVKRVVYGNRAYMAFPSFRAAKRPRYGIL